MSTKLVNKNNRKQMLDEFFYCISEGMGLEDAGKKAGFSNPNRDVARELHNPDFLPAMAEALRHRLGAHLAAKAMRLAEKLLDDKRTNVRVRWDVAKTILAAGAGFVPPKGKILEAPTQDIASMSANDIMTLRASLEREMGARADAAKTIDAAPLQALPAPPPSQAFDYLD